MSKRLSFYHFIFGIILILLIYYYMSEKIYDLCCQPVHHWTVSASTPLENVLFESGSEKLTFSRTKDAFVSNDRKMRNNRGRTMDFITLVTQTHVENIYLLDTIAIRWKGPISVAVFIDKNDNDQLRKVRFYHECFPHIRDNTTIHLFSPSDLKIDLATVHVDCIDNMNSKNYQGIYVLEDIEYPHNLLRNLALPDDEDGFIFTIDIDMVPSFDLYDTFLSLSSNLKDSLLISSIFIIPAFESMDFDEIPRSKQDLLDGLNSGLIQPYHNLSCPNCQIDTDFNKWLNPTPDVNIYKIKRTYCAYEPFYIVSRARHIMFDERFKGRGYDRISQVSEMWLAGFNFYVMAGSFVVHRGFHPAPPTTPPPPEMTTPSPPPPPTTLPQSVYEQRHWDFIRAKYLADNRIRGKIKTKYGNERIKLMERRLLLHNFTTEELRNQSQKIDWLLRLDADEETQYKLYMKYGDEGYIETTTPNVTTTTTLTYTKESPYTESPIDPHKFMFMQFLIEKWKIYGLDSRKHCLF